MKKKILVALLAVVLTVSCVIGTTLAWLVDGTETVTNVFTYGDVNIYLQEHTINTDGLTLSSTLKTTKADEAFEVYGYKMIPGNSIQKDPAVVVEKDSEPSWLFVKITEENKFSDFMTYEIAEGWTPVPGESNVYYRKVNNTTDTTAANYNSILEKDTDPLYILKNNKVNVNSNVTKEQLTAFDTNNNGSLDTTEKNALPKLIFTAYAVQQTGIDSVTDAWTVANNPTADING